MNINYYSIYDICIGIGIEYIIGQKCDLINSSSDQRENFTNYIKNPNMINYLIKNLYEESFILKSKEEDFAILPLLSYLRNERHSKYSKINRFNSMVKNVADNYLIPIAINQIEYTGLDKNYFFKNINKIENYIDFFSVMPSIDVFFTLCSYIENNLNRKLDKNDKNDIGFLSVAVPYCDIILTENEWAHVLISQKIDKKYNTTILSNLLDIQEVI